MVAERRPEPLRGPRPGWRGENEPRETPLGGYHSSVHLATDYIHPTPRGGRCRVRVYLPEDERDAPVVIYSELPTNESSSTTYAGSTSRSGVGRLARRSTRPKAPSNRGSCNGRKCAPRAPWSGARRPMPETTACRRASARWPGTPPIWRPSEVSAGALWRTLRPVPCGFALLSRSLSDLPGSRRTSLANHRTRGCPSESTTVAGGRRMALHTSKIRAWRATSRRPPRLAPLAGAVQGRRYGHRSEQVFGGHVAHLGDHPVRHYPSVHAVGVEHLHPAGDALERLLGNRCGVVVHEQVGPEARKLPLGGLRRGRLHLKAWAVALDRECYGLAVHLR